MVLSGNRCVICRNIYNVRAETLKTKNQSSGDVFSSWKRECATALCHVLFDKYLDYFANYFQNTHYCSVCEQLVRDISFTWKQVLLFQNRLKELSRNMCQMLDTNYQLIERRSQTITVEQRISYLLDTTNSLKTPDYSYDEMVEVIYSVMSNGLRLSSLAKQVTNLKSSLSKDLKTYQNSVSSFGEDVIPPTFYDNSKIKEELVYQEDDVCEASYSPNYDENDDQSEIKSENMSCIYENMETIRSNTVENKVLNDVKYDSENSNSSDQNANLIKKVKRKLPQQRLKRRKKLKKINRRTNKMYYCSEGDCRKRFSNQTTRQIHVQKVHRGELKPYKCTYCLRKFTSSDHLKRHENNVHEKGRILKTKNCKFCGSKFIEPDDLTSHYSQFHQPPDQFRCAYCTEVYQNSIDLSKHTKQSHPQPNICDICEKVFINESTLNRHHLKNHKGKNPWLECPKCDRKFAIQSWLNSHMESHNESKLFKCDICEHEFKYSQQLKIHFKAMHEKGQFECNDCGTILTTLYDLKAHGVAHYYQPNVEQKIAKLSKPRKERQQNESTTSLNLPSEFVYTCKFCGKGYIQESELNTHYATSHQGPNPFTCAFCPSIFNSSLILSKHRKTTHPDPHELENRRKCKYCDLYFANKSSLSVHSKIHIDSTSLLQCHLCSAVFRKRHTLNKHMEFHKDDSKYVCETCGKACSSSSALHIHSLTHPLTCAFCPAVYSNSVDLSQHLQSAHADTNDLVEKLKCQSCDRYFSDQKSLSDHSLSHLDPTLIRCPLCPATFKLRHLLNQHLETHNNEKKYVCEVCGKAYNRASALRRHSKFHDENNRKYQCSICDKKFFNSQHCKNHELTHTNVKEFVCQICGKSFNRDCNLSEHLKIHAGVPRRRPRKPKSCPNPENQDNVF